MIVACVLVGEKYSVDDVYRLRTAVGEHLPISYRFVCLTDRPTEVDVGNKMDMSGDGLSGRWAKMRLFDASWRIGQRVLYFPLRAVIVGDLTPMAMLDVDLGICPSGAMTIGPLFGSDVWQEFRAEQDYWMAQPGKVMLQICEGLGHTPVMLSECPE